LTAILEPENLLFRDIRPYLGDGLIVEGKEEQQIKKLN
jgi:hypothetical protein